MDRRQCEGCNNKATREDSAGVPLCEECYNELLESTKPTADNENKGV